ncbi:peroxidase 64, partial [Tanacetum coccineum]
LTQTKLQLSTSYHPQTDGQTEVINRGLEAYLRCFAHEQPVKWSSYLPWAEYSYNTGYHTSTGTTPFYVVYGREPPSLLPYVMGETKNAELEQQLVDRDDMLKLIRHNLHKAQDRMRQQANSKRRDISFEVGDYVFLKIQPYRQRSLAKRRYEKLSPRFFGPYRITRKVGPVAYKLDLPPESRIHPIFHVSMLKPANGPISADMAPFPITKDWEIDIQSHSVLAHRWVNEAGKQVLELLISWCDRPQEEATWETYDLLAHQFPNFRLKDKAFSREGSNDTIPVKVYTRKKNRVNETGLTEFNSIFVYWLDPLGQSCSWKIECCGLLVLSVQYNIVFSEVEKFYLELEKLLTPASIANGLPRRSNSASISSIPLLIKEVIPVPIEVLVRLLCSRSEATLIVALNALLVQESYDSIYALAMAESGAVKALLELVRGHQCEETAARLLEVLMHSLKIRETKATK